MRSTFLAFVMVFCIFSCKKDNNATTTETLKGKWSTGGYDIILYNSSGEVVSHSVVDAIKTYWTFDQSQIKLSNDINADVKTSNYKVLNTVGTRTLMVENAAIATFNNWIVDELSSNAMVISAQINDKSQLTYGKNQVAAKGVKAIYLSREP
ncbi:hypothetical protein ASE92_05835 [Pedobacter sp. Leaf41]|uniref:hypothetical protein n=1 Tax=Pedobacter sp. Leaf41 TaxID=1736218 RepID=UPI0007034575|nr:hypothetical protein [Pedobacter sp. Leaf41]KQN38934.1 hypothetical protein ASE92_05835 [Pedobacter sp. Leaf41]